MSRQSELRVLVNLTRLVPAAAGGGGAGWFALALCRALATRFTVSVLTNAGNEAYILRAVSGEQISLRSVGDNFNAHGHAVLVGAHVYIDPLNGLEPQSIPSDVLAIVVIYDLQFFEKPYFFTPGEVEFRCNHYGSAIDRADLVLTTNERQRRLIQRNFGKQSVGVIRQPAYFVSKASMQEGKPVTSPYLLYPSVQWNDKNHYRLVEAFSIRQRHSDGSCRPQAHDVGRAAG